MTNAADNSERDSERDPEMSARWREHSTEMPPASLDAAILAAAHRAVDSKPMGSALQGAGGMTHEARTPPRAATGPQRWWMPLAAAATIGAVAIGVLQTAPQEPSDMAGAAPTERQAPSVIPPRDKPTAASDVVPPAAPRTAPQAAPQNVSPMQRKDTRFGERGTAAVPASPMSRAEADAVPPPKPVGKIAAATNPVPEPFPADKKSEAADALAMQPPRPPAAPAPAIADARMRSNIAREQPARSDAAQEQRARSDVAQAASGDNMLAKSRAGAESGATKITDVDAAVMRIRKLYDDGKLAAAAKELIALRTAVPDADARLPLELRAWASTVKP